MKKTLLFIFSLLTLSLWAQEGINYQGAATDANGYELTNQSISIRASVLSASASGNLQWEETHSATTDQFGLFNVAIGQGTNTTNGATATFDDMDWGAANHFLKIEMDVTGGTNYAMIGTTQMMAVPYALYAKSANINYDSISNLLSNDSTFITNVGGGMGGGGCDFLYPDGYNGEAITMELIGPASYTVPNGKRLYVLSYSSGGGPNINGIFADFGDGKPIILNAGDILANDNGSDGAMNGFLVNANTGIDAITMELNASTSYTVPNGKRLYILRHSGGGANINGIQAANFIIANKPIILNAGDMFGNDNMAQPSQMHGYLVDENYFAGCGGGSSSGASNATIDSLSQVVSSLDSSLTALTSFFTFGCTDSLAFNYNPNANVDDYSCVAIIYGCTDSTAFNYNTLANTDDGSCILSLVIGINYQGGIIFYLDGTGGGLIAYPWNISNSAQWGCHGTFIGGTGWAIGTGNQNTINIEAGCTTSGTAADLCANLIINGYSDWFLPSMDELNEMYLNIGQGNALGLGNIGSFYNNEYCSSTENGGHQAYVFDFTNGNNYGVAQKYETFRVRAIRCI